MQSSNFNFNPFSPVRFYPFNVLYARYPSLTILAAIRTQFSAAFPVAPNSNFNNINQSIAYFPPLEFDRCLTPGSNIKEEGSQDPKIEEENINFCKKEENMDADSNCDVNYDQERYSIQVKEMLIYILKNFEQLKEGGSAPKNSAYAYHPVLLKLFDIIIQRYCSAFRTKDEILKYITRKAFKYIKNNCTKENHGDEALLSETLCRRYFKASIQEIEQLGVSINSNENFLQILFPYKKNCKNTQKYKVLIQKLCNSMEFYQDYCKFLSSFKDTIQREKERKIDIFASYVCNCLERDKIDDILQYKRIPWLDSWTNLAQMTAQEISITLKVRASNHNRFEKKKTKKVKIS